MVDRSDLEWSQSIISSGRPKVDNLYAFKRILSGLNEINEYFDSLVAIRKEKKGGWFNGDKVISKTVVNEDNKRYVEVYILERLKDIDRYMRFLEKQGVDESTEEYRSLGVIKGDLMAIDLKIDKLKSVNRSDLKLIQKRNELKKRFENALKSLSMYADKYINIEQRVKKSA